MTKQECENQMLSKLKEIWDIYKEYDSQGNHLSLCAMDDYFDIFSSNRSVRITEVGGEKVEY